MPYDHGNDGPSMKNNKTTTYILYTCKITAYIDSRYYCVCDKMYIVNILDITTYIRQLRNSI